MMYLQPLKIGAVEITTPLVLSPMAGVTDQPMRSVARAHGAGYTVAEMLTADTRLWRSRKSRLRRRRAGESGPMAVQIAGSVPAELAAAARACEAAGAPVIDINMGCPAKKVCRRWAGSALLQDEALVADILNAVVGAVSCPVTLKIRTGWHQSQVNGVTIARIAEDCGIRALAVHGRTRDMAYRGSAEYDTIADICRQISIPVFANGDIDSPAKAKFVLDYTAADGLYIGRAAQGRPWLFREIRHYLETGSLLPAPTVAAVREVIFDHVRAIHRFYGDPQGVRIARKHLGWYAAQLLADDRAFRRAVFAAESADAQLAAAGEFVAAASFAHAASSNSIQCVTGVLPALARCS